MSTAAAISVAVNQTNNETELIACMLTTIKFVSSCNLSDKRHLTKLRYFRK